MACNSSLNELAVLVICFRDSNDTILRNHWRLDDLLRDQFEDLFCKFWCFFNVLTAFSLQTALIKLMEPSCDIKAEFISNGSKRGSRMYGRQMVKMKCSSSLKFHLPHVLFLCKLMHAQYILIIIYIILNM